MAGDDFCYLTTTGRRSGTPHEIEIWYALDERAEAAGPGVTVFLLAGGGRSSDWVRNVAVDPAVTVRFGDDPTASPAGRASSTATAPIPTRRSGPGASCSRSTRIGTAATSPTGGGARCRWRSTSARRNRRVAP